MQEAIPLTGKERRFSDDEFIVSKTDTRGIITYANDVFLRIADYRLEEVLGKPHNMIRHPGMPRCIFKFLWDRIKSGNEVFAYVNNRTKFGDHYWVFAHVTPSYDDAGQIIGFHSNRRSPTPASIAKVSPLYQQLRAMEDAAPTPQQGVAASSEALTQWVNANGGNYDALIHTL